MKCYEIFRFCYSLQNDDCVSEKRQRKKSDRLGEIADDDDLVTLDDSKEMLYCYGQSENELNVDSTNESDERILSKADKRPKNSNVHSKQTSRIEAKVNHLQTLLEQIQRSIISNIVNGAAGITDFESIQNTSDLLPLKTVESLDQFDSDLSTSSYRKKIVSLFNILFYKKVCSFQP